MNISTIAKRYLIPISLFAGATLFVTATSEHISEHSNPVFITPTEVPTTTIALPTVPPTEVPTPTTTTTTVAPDFSGVDFVALAREKWGKCGEFHDLAISVGWPEEEWKHLSAVMYRESRCKIDAWNGADAGLTQINQIHSSWLSDMGFTHPEDMFSPEKNLLFAFRLWETSGWRPWRFSGSTFD